MQDDEPHEQNSLAENQIEIRHFILWMLVWPVELHRDGKWVMQRRNHL